MKIQELKEVLQGAYSREKWIKTLQFLSGNKNLLSISLEPKPEIIKSAKAKEIVFDIIRLGTLKTIDGISLPIYDTTLQDGIKIEYNRVGVNDLLKKHILKDAIKGAIVTFHYKEEYSKKEWRFSFISKFGGSDYFAELESVETNPKKYTYIFGTPEEHRTALERLYNLEQSRFRLEDFFEAFNVEPVSNNFFKEYNNFYHDFISELSNNKQSRKIFEKEGITIEELEKDIRNFVKRLLGRLVFLYFLQKKRWLGASNKNYNDGDTNFLYNLFNHDNESRINFYNKWLSELFFNALNTPNRLNDSFKLPHGDYVWIPFLNGGLFEENQEPNKHREIQFPPKLFELLFKFFNSYNFTIFENSPEDHTIAVDPEMLGRIFENLLEDNKDKGTFYTPKEIVQYMTQESLIEYLKINLPHSRENIENLVKHHNSIGFKDSHLIQVERLIDEVKICDPAIGSGAFPMGLLQEIFALKALIHFKLDRDISSWEPAKIKQEIIQNSIFGVDLENDAVDIARLRFWLSLVVDEDIPKPLPNLDFKIVHGNSILSRFNVRDSINNVFKDLNSKRKKEKKEEVDISHYKNLMKEYLNATDPHQKTVFKHLINEIKSAFTYNLSNKEINNISIARGQYQNLIGDNLFGEKKGNKKDVLKAKKRLEYLETQRDDKEKGKLFEESFEWRFEFPDVLNEDGDFTGFDIVIGNPPYVSAVNMRRTDLEKSEFKKQYPEATGSYDLYLLFLLRGEELMKENGIYCWIIPNKFLIANYSKKTKERLIQKSLKYSLNVSNFDVFKGIGVYPIILFGNSNQLNNYKELKINKFSDLLYRKFEEVEELPDYKKFKDFNLKINSGATGFQAKEIKQFVYDNPTENSIPFTVSGNIDRYKWNNKKVKYMGDTYIEAYIEKNNAIANTKIAFWERPKIVIAGMTKVIEAVYVKSELGLGVGIYGIYEFGNFSPYCLTGLLNSKFYSYYFRKKFKDKHLAGGYLAINKSTIEEFPLIEMTKANQSVIDILSQIIHFFNNELKTEISNVIKNNFISNFFEEIIDGCVFELYFEEHMEEKDINIIDDVKNYLQKSGLTEDFEKINEETKKQKIWELYKEMSTGIVQIKMTDFVTKSPEILKPILQS
ncbi:Eco57I restriction-modification methylase domain-containing protein [Flavobacterium sp. NRK1]|uniref:Eco57I restriction-modification methylase domain-containing protein n=1 Tax=Flavobacterium sp. NRK1 TaxID=2954929 RepID=UPI00209312D9|nr:TaqI-like C-terminal specificity domain-containing protein [Flavobacterium sp. NRK1]MCO6147385.1 Eco57I restriction-modification methylase domain-containing protein [Flavobacterium sp. NRK1]